jgi:hypothetical protein
MMQNSHVVHELRAVLAALQTSYRILEKPHDDVQDILSVQKLALEKVSELITNLEKDCPENEEIQ